MKLTQSFPASNRAPPSTAKLVGINAKQSPRPPPLSTAISALQRAKLGTNRTVGRPPLKPPPKPAAAAASRHPPPKRARKTPSTAALTSSSGACKLAVGMPCGGVTFCGVDRACRARGCCSGTSACRRNNAFSWRCQ
jgi:hypothetical protein